MASRPLAADVIAVALLAACGAPAPSASPTAAPSLATPATGCPNPEGGECLGPLGAGTYESTEFRTGVTYSVPDGWSNQEDLPGNFLLVPPSSTLEGVNAGTSDYIGMYDGIAAASADCDESPQPGVEATPEAMADWYAGLPGLEMSEPQQVTIGGLFGLVFNVVLADAYTGTCPYPGLEDVPMVPLIIGHGPASLDHVVVGEITTRLFLLGGPTGDTIAIEVSDVPGGTSLEELDAVVHSFEFDLPAS